MRKIKKLNSKWQNGKSTVRAKQQNISANIYLYSCWNRFLRACLLASLRVRLHSFIFSPFISCILRWPVCLFTCLFYRFARCFTLSRCLYCGFSLSLAFCFFITRGTGFFPTHCGRVVLSYNHNLNAGKVFCLFSFFLAHSLCLRICV